MRPFEFYTLCRECQDILKAAAPYKTGNLRYNAIKLEITGDTCRIYVDEKIAPYMKYTNEPWTNGNKNPNERWFDRAVKKIAQHIAERTRGDLHDD